MSPNQRDPNRVGITVYVPRELQAAFKEAAAHRGETATAALIRAMQSYVNRNHPSRLGPKD